MMSGPYKSKNVRVVVDGKIVSVAELVNIEWSRKLGVESKYGMRGVHSDRRHAEGKGYGIFTIRRWYKTGTNTSLFYQLHENDTLFDLELYLTEDFSSTPTDVIGWKLEDCLSYNYKLITGAANDIVSEEIHGYALAGSFVDYEDVEPVPPAPSYDVDIDLVVACDALYASRIMGVHDTTEVGQLVTPRCSVPFWSIVDDGANLYFVTETDVVCYSLEDFASYPDDGIEWATDLSNSGYDCASSIEYGDYLYVAQTSRTYGPDEYAIKVFKILKATGVVVDSYTETPAVTVVSPKSIACDGTYLYVSKMVYHEVSATVLKIQMSDMSLVDTYDPSSTVGAMIYDSDSGNLFAIVGTAIQKRSTTFTLVDSHDFGVAISLKECGMAMRGDYVYIVKDTGTIYKVSKATLSVNTLVLVADANYGSITTSDSDVYVFFGHDFAVDKLGIVFKVSIDTFTQTSSLELNCMGDIYIGPIRYVPFTIPAHEPVPNYMYYPINTSIKRVYSNQHEVFYYNNRWWTVTQDETTVGAYDLAILSAEKGTAEWVETICRTCATDEFQIAGFNFSNVATCFDGTYFHYAGLDWSSGDCVLRYRRGEPQSDGTIDWSFAEEAVYPFASDGYVYYPHIACDVNGVPYISVSYDSNSTGRTVWAYIFSRSGGTWTLEETYNTGIDWNDDTDVYGFPLVALDNGSMYFAWYDYGLTDVYMGKIVESLFPAETITTYWYTLNPYQVNLTSINNEVFLITFDSNNSNIGIWKRTVAGAWSEEKTYAADATGVDNAALFLAKDEDDVIYAVASYSEITARNASTTYVAKRTAAGVWDVAMQELFYEVVECQGDMGIHGPRVIYENGDIPISDKQDYFPTNGTSGLSTGMLMRIRKMV